MTRDNYGQWWNEAETGPEWYRNLFKPRRMVHEAFMKWTEGVGPMADVLEVGCGCAFHYPGFFSTSRYVGVDVSLKEVEWSRANDDRAWHQYYCGDIVEMTKKCSGSTSAHLEESAYDLVFAHAVIDHVPSPETLIESCLYLTRRWVYLTAYRGWFPDLKEHRQIWSEAHSCFYNDLSPQQIERFIRSRSTGVLDVTIGPIPVRNGRITQETVVIGRKPMGIAITTPPPRTTP